MPSQPEHLMIRCRELAFDVHNDHRLLSSTYAGAPVSWMLNSVVLPEFRIATKPVNFSFFRLTETARLVIGIRLRLSFNARSFYRIIRTHASASMRTGSPNGATRTRNDEPAAAQRA